MRGWLALGSTVSAFALGPSAAAAPPTISIQASVTAGAAPLHVVLTAGGDAAAYHWDFGDGASADGNVVAHDYRGGRFTTTLTGTASSGETATAQAVVTAYAVAVDAGRSPLVRRYGVASRFRGHVVPAERGVGIVLAGPGGTGLGRARSNARGAFVIHARARRPGDYTVRSRRGAAAAVPVVIVPRLLASLEGSSARGSRYELVARVVPAAAGRLAVVVASGSRRIVDRTGGTSVRVRLDTRRLATYRIFVRVENNVGYTSVRRRLTARIVLPRLAYGARGFAVTQLAAQLRGLRYAAPVSAVFDGRLLDAVYAFQKVQGLPRTGVVDPVFWRRLAAPHVPRPRYANPADHLEVNKPQQVLFVVRARRVALIVAVSTAGIPGRFTPVGRFAIYRKVGGFDPSPLGTLYDPLYFTGGYAIHGNPSVPPYPASHGCVRVPMWIAPHLYETNAYGETVYVY